MLSRAFLLRPPSATCSVFLVSYCLDHFWQTGHVAFELYLLPATITHYLPQEIKIVLNNMECLIGPPFNLKCTAVIICNKSKDVSWVPIENVLFVSLKISPCYTLRIWIAVHCIMSICNWNCCIEWEDSDESDKITTCNLVTHGKQKTAHNIKPITPAWLLVSDMMEPSVQRGVGGNDIGIVSSLWWDHDLQIELCHGCFVVAPSGKIMRAFNVVGCCWVGLLSVAWWESDIRGKKISLEK